MDRARAFAAWAPGDSIWTPWVKPILFAHIAQSDSEPRAIEAPAWAREAHLLGPMLEGDYRSPALRTRSAMPAVIVDLPGLESVAAGAALATIGFRPVPLYNAIPAFAAIVPMEDVVEALVSAVPLLEAARLAPDAPPAFLLDARRAGRPGAAREGQFDNRSIAFPSDFPSIAKLRNEGIASVIVIRETGTAPASDLTPMLAAWQRAGLGILVMSPESTRGPEPYRVQRGSIVERVRSFFKPFSLYRREDGSFGQLIVGRPHSG